MPPFLVRFASRANFHPADASNEFRQQWTHPGDVFSVLLILGGDVVARALAQSTGWRFGLPSFSFGWVAYAVRSLVVVVGENKLMPEPDYSCLVVNGKSGHARDNKSWIIGRMVRDYDRWMDNAIRLKVRQILEEKRKENEWEELPLQAGLCVSIYKTNTEEGVGKPTDWLLVYQSIAIAILQLGVAAIPCSIVGDWGILIITAAGILLSSVTASLSHWRKEKWGGCRRLRKGEEKNVILTRGNGSQHAIVILGSHGFLDLEDLAIGQKDATTSTLTRLSIGTLAALWILLLISASGIKNNTWFLLAVGGIGSIFNVWVAGRWKHPKSVGLPLTYHTVIAKTKVMKTLYAVEEKEHRLGKAMLPIFFPGGLHKDEEITWSHLAGDYENARRAAICMDEGRWEEAEKLEEQLYRVLKKQLGTDSDFTLKSMENMILIYRNQGRQKAADELEDEVRKIREEKQADDFRYTGHLGG
ncbi:hypothetical protein F4777DRAFT_401961 [Nemania sp. FL0916]|nr:hypothetical protein F4777DRAFT_401961 [Nemania sp. FL0916]